MADIFKPTPEQTLLLRKCGSADLAEASAAQKEFAGAMKSSMNLVAKVDEATAETALREGLMPGDIINNIFKVVPLDYNETPEFPLHFLVPGTENEYVAFTLPRHGRIPEKHIEADYVMVNTFRIGNAIDWDLRFSRSARWDVVGDAVRTMRNGFVKKTNDDGFHTLIAAAVDRNIVVYDSAATAGTFSKRLVSLLKVVMRRNAGGNSTSLNRGRLTHLCVSPEALEDIRNWNIDQVDEVTRREIFVAADGTFNSIFGTNLIDIDELGEGQEYQNYYANTLSASLPGSKLEFVLGLDLSKPGTLVRPVRGNGEPEVYDDPTLLRRGQQGYFSWLEHGFGVLDGRVVLAGAC
jgi:hypothetical protein